MEKLIPLGSILNLNNGTHKIMIIGRGVQAEIDGEMRRFDYSGCIYPLGMLSAEMVYFNAENIAEVIFEGYTDDDEEKFQAFYDEVSTHEDVQAIPRGTVG